MFSHSLTLYLAVQGRKHTRYAAAWTLVNAHELAVISGKYFLIALLPPSIDRYVFVPGMAAAYALGASYPKELAEE
jgi:hypothetical protein